MPRRAPSWCVWAAAVVWLGLWGITAVTVFWSPGWTRDFGYSLERRSGNLYVFRVDPGGPADGKLKPGDGVVAINGDGRASTGGALRLLDLPRDATYTMRLSRGGAEIEYTLRLPFRRFLVPWWGVASCLISALAGIAMGTLLGLAKPESRTVRYAAAFLFLSACMALSVAINATVLQGFRLALLGLLGVLGNLNGPIGYQCASAFPVPVKEASGWKVVKGLVWAAGLFCWLLLFPSELTWLFGTDIGLGLYARYYAVADAASLLWIRVFPLRGIVLSLAVSAVLIRNYRGLNSAGERRRIRLVVIGVLAALAPQLVLQAGFALYKLTGRGIDPNGITAATIDMAIAPLVTLVLAPLLAYAILKHRVLGIEIVIRKGLHYLLAKRALQALLITPAALVAVRVAVKPSLPVAEVLFGNWWWGCLIVASAIALRFRRPLLAALDRKFFREAYDRERILKESMEHIQACGWSPQVEQSVCSRIEAALHPERLVFLRNEPAGDAVVPAYVSEPAQNLPGPNEEVLLRWLEGRQRAEDISRMHTLPEADRNWLLTAGIELAVPVRGTGGGLGVLLIGAKKSEEPYDATDRALLDAIAAQLGITYENYCLKESVDREKQTRLQVLAQVSEAGINLLRECPACGACYDGPAERCPADGRELAPTLPVERVLDGKYRLERRIGAGGMGAVYRAWDLRLNRPIAVKVMVGALFGKAAALHRFEREARTAARLNHPNIVAVYDFNLIGGGAYLVMELIEGRSLRAELDARGPVSLPQAAAWFDQLLAGLEAAHQAGVVHRDLKPANVLVAKSSAATDEIKLADFGLARLKAVGDGESLTLTVSGTVLGTMGYMSPEQLLGKEADERSDLFSVGVLVLEAISGRRPFSGRTPQELLATLSRGGRPLAGEGPEVDRLNAILGACLEYDPTRRPGSAAELRAELIGALRSCPPLPSAAQSVAVVHGGNTETERPGSP